MALTAPVVFPLRPILPGPSCTCALGSTCGRIGKHPAALWRDLAYGDPVERPVEGAGFGLKTGAVPKGSGVFVVDIDNEKALQAFAELNGGALPVTLVVATGQGWQFYFQHPGFPVRNSQSALCKGVDIRGDGGFVVGVGSPHRNGKTYAVLRDEPPRAAPDWLLEWDGLERAEDDTPIPVPTPVAPGSPEEAERMKLAIGELLNAPAAVAGQRGHHRLWVVSQILVRTLELPLQTAYALLVEHYNPRCDPPWGAREIWHKLEEARDKGRFELRHDIEEFDRALLETANSRRKRCA